jgi:propanediol dehydratase small subunit
MKMDLLFFIVILIGVGVSVLINIPLELKSRRLLQRFWSRSCTGWLWKRRFPDASKDSIRDFLELFVDAFALSSDKRLKFAPDDKIMDIYKSLYPSSWWGDALEYECLCIDLERRYGLDLTENVMDENITLGQLFYTIRNHNGNSV